MAATEWLRENPQIISCIRRVTRRCGFDVRLSEPDILRDMFRCLVELRDEPELLNFELDFIEYCTTRHERSKGQIYQDLFVQFVLGNKRNGFFVEFGAASGIELSNSYLLEKEYEWDGILAEPARRWHDSLKRNRESKIDTRCVWSRTGELVEFNEAIIGELSTIGGCATDNVRANRAVSSTYPIETISLADLLRFHDAPEAIDYLSIDTEGSELSILENFEFDNYSVNIITAEHNHVRKRREGIYSLLTGKGYQRVLEKFSDFEDWYVEGNLLREFFSRQGYDQRPRKVQNRSIFNPYKRY